MSVQLAKTQSGNNSTQGRRTPSLSLTQPGKSAAGNRSGGSPAVNSSVTVEKNDKHEKSSSNNDAASIDKSTATTTKQTTKNDLNEKHTGATSTAAEMKKDEIFHENGITNGHKRNDSNKDDDKKSTTDAVPVRGSPRNKEKKEQQKDEKNIAESPKKVEKVGEKTRKKNEKDNNKEKTSEESEKKKTATEKNGESVELKKTDKKALHDIESGGKRDEKKSQEIITVKSGKKDDEKKQESATKEKKKSQDIENFRRLSITENQPLLTKEKSDDMEPLVFEAESEIPGQPDASSTPGKVLKHRQGPLHSEEKLNEESMRPTVTTLKVSSATHSFHRDSPAFISSIATIPRPGRISGRRSFRNLPEVSFENRYAGSYRQIPDDDRWPSSMNVTVGSEIPNESSSTAGSFSFFSRGKKRERTPPINQIMGSQESELSPKSPKRARLDFSGFFGFVASPMTMLRAKFSKAKIQSSSTPNSKGSKNKKSAADAGGNSGGYSGNDDEEDVVNVSGIVADEEITAVEAAGSDGDVSIVDDIIEDDLAQEIEKDAAATDEKVMSAGGNDDDVVGVKEQISTAASTESVVNKRKMCNVM